MHSLRDGSRDQGFEKILGLGYREDGQLRFNPPAPLMKDLEQKMPAVAWDLLPMEKYRAQFVKEAWQAMIDAALSA